MKYDLPHEYLLSILDYNPESGRFIWKNSKHAGRNGSVAGKLGDGTYNNYAVIGLFGRQYSISRLAWFYTHGEWPKHQLHFVNRDPGDTRISNLVERIPKKRYQYMKSDANKRLPAYKQNRTADVNRRQALKSKFGITPEKYVEMLLAQNGVCAVCSKPETSIHNGKVRPLSVDHDHETGAVRDLLCGKCNSGLGYFNDDLTLMAKAIGYLRRHAAPDESNVVPFLKTVGDES